MRKTKQFRLGFFIFLIFSLGSFSICFSQEEKTDDIEYLDLGGGEKIPLYADPCERTGDPKKVAASFIKENRFYQREVDKGKEIIAAINSGTVEDDNMRGKIIELGLHNWACENGYKQKRTRGMGWPYFLKNPETQEGIYIGLQVSYGMHYEGLRQGYAEFELDTRGMAMDTYYLQVYITDLNPDPNEESSSLKDEKATKVLNEVIDYSYKYAVAYYTALAELAAEMEQE